jgi:hypothetical protein
MLATLSQNAGYIGVAGYCIPVRAYAKNFNGRTSNERRGKASLGMTGHLL